MNIMMSSIPVRRATVKKATKTDRNDGNGKTEKISEDENRHSPPENKAHSKHLLRLSSKEQLIDENTKLRSDLQQQGNQLKDLESTLNSTRNELSCSREENVTVKERCERALLLANIDPVTLQQICEDAKDFTLQQRREKAKKASVDLQERLRNFNTQAAAVLENMKEMSSSVEQLASGVDHPSTVHL